MWWDLNPGSVDHKCNALTPEPPTLVVNKMIFLMFIGYLFLTYYTFVNIYVCM